MASRLWMLFLWGAFICSPVIGQNKINVPRVLLPRATDVVTNFTLKVTDGGELGCFKWESSRTDVATVTAFMEEDGTRDCSASAVVSALSKSDHRLTSIVWAEHVTSRERFRCDIIVDTIDSIEIVTTTLELFLEDAPEAFEIKAKDAKGDTFTSLDGLEVEWKISNDIQNDSVFMDAHNILRLTKFSDTQYKPPASIFSMEAAGKRGFMVLVEGLQTGSAVVTASLKHQAFRSVESASVRIVVVANLVLQPPHDVYMLQYGRIHYKVQQIKQARSFEIEMPSNQYYLEIEDDSLCQLDEPSTTVTCTDLGDTQVVLRDRNMKETDAHHPSAVIHVVEPAYINLVIFPGRNWVLQRGRHYEILAELYDRDSHLIYSSDNLLISLVTPESYFDVLQTTRNGSYQHVLAKMTGRTDISAHLASIKLPNGKVLKFERAITKTQIIEINEPVTVEPKRLLFPYQPESLQAYQGMITAQGGSGNFTWTSSDNSIAPVDRNSGKIKAGMKEGVATITAIDLKNSLHFDTSVVYVVPVADLTVLPSAREAEINKLLVLTVALRGLIPGSSKPDNFHDCRNVILRVFVSDESLFSIADEAVKSTNFKTGACTSVTLLAVKQGFTTVIISYVVGDSVIASQEVTVAVFNPLKNVEKESVTVLTIGSSKLFAFKGGPAPWIHEPSNHRVVLLDSTHGTILSRTVGGSSVFPLKEVSCVKLGEEDLRFQVGNAPSKTNPAPATSTISVKVVCASPARFEISPKLVRLDALELSRCPWEKSSGEPFPVIHNSELHLDISVYDHADRPFYNFSSLNFEWTTSDERLISVKNSDGFVFPWHRDALATEERSPNHKVVSVHDLTGRAVISAATAGYRREALDAVKSSEHARLDQKLKSAVIVVVVLQPKFSRGSVSVFNHPANKELISIMDGSGYFQMVASNPHLVKVMYDLKSRTLAVLPNADGTLVVTAYDVCIAAKPIEIPVTVAGLDRIELLVGDKVEIGKSIRMLVRVFDSAHKPLPTKLYHLIGIAPVLNSDLISLKEETSTVDRIYSVHGNALGRVSVNFKGISGDRSEIFSKPKDIQVFPSLRIDPRNVTIFPTGRFQIIVNGGPQPQTSVVFSVKKSLIASIDAQSGLMEAVQLGSTSVLAQIVDLDPVTGKDTVYSQDEAEIHVVPLLGLKIRASSRVLEVGTDLPLVAMGLNDNETPFSFGSVIPSLRFDWSVDNSDIVELRSLYATLKESSTPENNFAVRLRAVSQGAAVVRLSLGGAAGKLPNGTDQLRIRVVESLQLIGVSCGQSLLITPHTQAFLKTTRDGEGRITYRVVDGEDILQVDGQGQVFTDGRLGDAVLEIVAVEPDLTRTLSVVVQVKETSYLRLNLISSVVREDGLFALPVGVPVRLKSTLHDELGREFFATNSQLKYRANRYDYLHTAWSRDINNTIIARPVKVGETVLRVWDAARPTVSDTVLIRGAPVIRPDVYDAVVGEIVCYDCPLVTTDGRAGRWSSSSSNVYISKENGLAIAVAPGKASVYYNMSSDIVSKADITVKPLERLRFGSHLIDRALTNSAAKQSSLKIPVSFGRTRSTCTDFDVATFADVARKLWDFEKDLFRCDVRFDKQHQAGITADDVFTVVSDIDPTSGQFACVIELKPTIRHLDEALSSFEAVVILTLRSARGSEEPDVLKIDFYPNLFVHTPEIHLNHVQLESTLVITSTAAVQKSLTIRASDAGIVDIGSAREDAKKVGFWLYPIRLLTGPSLAIRLQGTTPLVVIECLKTDQHDTVPLKIRYVGESTRAGYQSTASVDYWPYVIPTAVIVGLLSIAWLLWYLYQQSLQDRHYYQYLAAAGQNPSLLQRTSSISPRRNDSMSFSPQATRTPSPTRQSFLGPSPGVLWKNDNSGKDITIDEDFAGARLWSTHRGLPSANTPQRRSPGYQ